VRSSGRSPEFGPENSCEDSYSLEEGLRITTEWMRRVYNLKTHNLVAASFEG
jgi:hypothetical protein